MNNNNGFVLVLAVVILVVGLGADVLRRYAPEGVINAVAGHPAELP